MTVLGTFFRKNSFVMVLPRKYWKVGDTGRWLKPDGCRCYRCMTKYSICIFVLYVIKRVNERGNKLFSHAFKWVYIGYCYSNLTPFFNLPLQLNIMFIIYLRCTQ